MAGRSKAEQERRRDLFVRAYATTGDAAASAVAAGYSERSAKQTGQSLLAEPALAERAHAARKAWVDAQGDAFERQQKSLVIEADTAIRCLSDIASGRAEFRGAQARVQAAVAILDRAGHKPVERVQAEVTQHNVADDLSDEDLREIMLETLRVMDSPCSDPTTLN